MIVSSSTTGGQFQPLLVTVESMDKDEAECKVVVGSRVAFYLWKRRFFEMMPDWPFSTSRLPEPAFNFH